MPPNEKCRLMESPTLKQKPVVSASTPKNRIGNQSDLENETPKREERVSWTEISEVVSPKISSPRDTPDEFGWDESPEPLRVDAKPRNPRGTLIHIRRRVPPPMPQHVRNPEDELAALQKITSRLLKCKNASNSSPSLKLNDEDDLTEELLIACTQSVENNVDKQNVSKEKKDDKVKPEESPKGAVDVSFERVLRSFCEEDDEWLTQAVVEPRTPVAKALFCKARSSLQLESPPSTSSFRRTSSFGPTETPRKASSSSRINMERPLKKQKSFQADTAPIRHQYTKEEIERKRLAAMFRKDQLEIERKRQEALRLRERKRIANANKARR